MLLAVLEKRCGFRLGAKDVFLNIAGGIRVEDPAIDLSETHPTDAPSWVNYSGTHDPQAAELARERANARAEAARREAEIAAKQTALDNEIGRAHV